MNIVLELHKISIAKIIEMILLYKFVKKDICLKKIDELEIRKKKSKHPSSYDKIIAEIKEEI